MTNPIYSQDGSAPNRWLFHAVLAGAVVLCVGAAAVALVFLLPEDDKAAEAQAPVATASVAPAPSEDTDAEWATLPVLPGDTAPTGTGSGEKTTISFVNHTGEAYVISWLEEDGTKTPYSTLAPDEVYEQTTYAGHYWLVAASDGTPVAIFQATDRPGRAIIE